MNNQFVETLQDIFIKQNQYKQLNKQLQDEINNEFILKKNYKLLEKEIESQKELYEHLLNVLSENILYYDDLIEKANKLENYKLDLITNIKWVKEENTRKVQTITNSRLQLYEQIEKISNGCYLNYKQMVNLNNKLETKTNIIKEQLSDLLKTIEELKTKTRKLEQDIDQKNANLITIHKKNLDLKAELNLHSNIHNEQQLEKENLIKQITKYKDNLYKYNMINSQLKELKTNLGNNTSNTFQKEHASTNDYSVKNKNFISAHDLFFKK
ncbi:hypothetical protein M0813_04244 [Anaeramoeba flamelloides]|uniref:Uncharacterized protein n=1 Tax=Anaeramoeba flamelloides TaxID=1746091 RepID=A0ABQ8XJZ4_9EUKA|nr:hypothetical protein M0813_04244 [Anaeramoeba flamelloides]